MTAEEFQTKRASSGGKWINEPGTYSLIVTGVTVKEASQYDSQWVNVLFNLEDSEGKCANHFLEVPTTNEKSFMYGSKKSLAPYNNLDRFLKGFGVTLEFTEAISQLESLFSDPEKTFIGKTISVRMGYYSNYTKYVGKDGDVSQYQIVDKNGAPVVDLKFSGFEAAKAYAEANSIKLQGFPKIQDVVPATTASISTSKSTADLPL